MRKLTAILMLLTGCAVSALATVPVPEIDASSGVSAIALIAGVALVIRGRRHRS